MLLSRGYNLFNMLPSFITNHLKYIELTNHWGPAMWSNNKYGIALLPSYGFVSRRFKVHWQSTVILILVGGRIPEKYRNKNGH